MTTSKQIISNERIMNLKEIRNNMIVTEIPNISEFDLENCLEAILKFNRNVDFYTYEYSKDSQTIYLYSDKEVDLKGYHNFITNKPVIKTSEILKEIRNVLTRTKTNDLESISLYDVFKVINQNSKKYENLKYSFANNFENILNSKCKRKFTVNIYDFDYANDMLKLSLDSKINSDWYRSEYMYFSKVNGKICLSSEKTLNSDIVLFLLGNHLSKLHDHFMTYKDFVMQNAFNVATDSKFVINITRNGIDVSSTIIRNRFKNDFRIFLANNGVCKYDFNSTDITKLLNGKEKELFEKIFVKIENCPKHLHNSLYEIRKEELSKKGILISLKEKSLKLTQQFMSKIK